MRSTVIGIVMGVVFIAALFGVAQLYPHSAQTGFAGASQGIQPGYVGAKMIGPWQFVCAKDQSDAPASKAPIPFTLNPNPHGGAAAMTQAQQTALGRCRVSLVYRKKDDPKAIALVVSFRYARIGQRLAMIVRFPVLAQTQKGDKVLMQVSEQAALPLFVDVCGQQVCVAAGMFAAQGQELLLNARQGVLIIPAKKDVKPLKVRVPLTGLKDLLAAVRQAES